MSVSGNQNIVSNTNTGKSFKNKNIAVLPVKAQTSLAPDSVLALRAELNKRLGPTLRSKLSSSQIIDVPIVANKLNQTNTLTVFEQLISTYENTGVMDNRHLVTLGNSLSCNYILLSRLKAEKMDIAILGKGMGASLEVMLINASNGEIDWAGSGEWKRGGILGTGGTTPEEMAENLITLAFESLQSSGGSEEGQIGDNPAPPVFQEATNQTGEGYSRSKKQLVAQAQRQLIALGYEPGPADGKMGKKTINALKKFQQDNNLTETGQTDQQTISILKQKINE